MDTGSEKRNEIFWEELSAAGGILLGAGIGLYLDEWKIGLLSAAILYTLIRTATWLIINKQSRTE